VREEIRVWKRWRKIGEGRRNTELQTSP